MELRKENIIKKIYFYLRNLRKNEVLLLLLFSFTHQFLYRKKNFKGFSPLAYKILTKLMKEKKNENQY
jgi:hypothetical protein